MSRDRRFGVSLLVGFLVVVLATPLTGFGPNVVAGFLAGWVVWLLTGPKSTSKADKTET